MSNTLRAIAWGGALCAVLDGTCVTLLYGAKGIKAIQVWQGVASSILGAKAFRLGWRSGMLGLLLHCAVAFTVATVFVLISPRIPMAPQHYILAGLGYGIVVFAVMNLIVVPLSAMPKRPTNASLLVAQVLMHLLLVGLPISAAAHHFAKSSQ